MGFKNTYKQAGNVLFTLLGAVALGGVLTAGVAGVMRGPLSGAMNVHRQNMAEEQLSLTAKVATRVSVQQPSNGDCDADGYVEPLPYVDAGTNPKPAGGGYIPAAMGVAEKDPWNRKYGYCPFDHGSVINGAGCGGAGQLRRTGTNVSKWEAFGVISAGPDGVFQTSCNNWADANTNGEPDTPLINKPQGSDDIVFTWTYEEAVAASDGLWNTETMDPNTAEVDKNISVKDGLGDEQLNFDTTSKQLTLGDGGKGSFPTVNTDSIGMMNPPLNWAQTSTGGNHTCATRTDGTAWCWGTNTSGQLGDGTTTQRNSPVQVGTDTTWVKVTASNNHSCGIKMNGTLWCWGNNGGSELGIGSTGGSQPSPVQVGTATDWSDVSSQMNATCALKTGGTIWCWGQNGNAQLGIGSTGGGYNSPQQTVGTGWAKLSSGGLGACGIKTNGTLWCWGSNGNGEVGDGTTTARNSPVQIGAGTDWLEVEGGGSHRCGIKTNGTLWCWGYGLWGQIGDGTTTQRTSPVQVGTGTNWVKVGAMYEHTCATKTDGTLWCWGDNVKGQVGDGTNGNTRTSPVQVPGGNWAVPSLGYGGNKYSCATKTDGTLWCWGLGSSGQIGNGGTGEYSTTQQVLGAGGNGQPKISIGNNVNAAGKLLVGGTEIIDENGIIQNGEQDPTIGDIKDGKFCTAGTATAPQPIKISAGRGPSAGSSCVIHKNATLWCWGRNNYGQLGDGTTTNSSIPIQLGAEKAWSDVAVGVYHACAIKNNGTLWCWGRNNYSQHGDGTTTDHPTPIQVGTATDWSTVRTSGDLHVCALKKNGTLWCWGFNGGGQVGDGTTTNRTTPVQVGTATDWAQLAVGHDHNCGIKTDGTLWCWGSGSVGRIGDGANTTRLSPVKVGTDTNWAQISLGSYFACAVKTNGTLWCWGENNFSQLGDGTTTNSSTPLQVGTDTNWAHTEAGFTTTCAVKTDGTRWCWGVNSGRYGNGATPNSTVPVQSGVDNDWSLSSSALGTDHGCALKTNGALWCWGLNAYGQVGDGTTSGRNSPVSVSVLNTQPEEQLYLKCTSDPPTGITPIQNGFTDTATEGAGCTELGELRKDGSGNLLVCDDNGGTSQIDGGYCGSFEPGALTFNPGMAMYFCADVPPPADCTLDGQTVPHGGSYIFYSAQNNPDCTSVDESRTCNDGTLSGDPSYQYASCSSAGSCTLPWGGMIANGASVTGYAGELASLCQSQTLTCNSGTLSGSPSVYDQQSCTLAPGGPCNGYGCYRDSASMNKACQVAGLGTTGSIAVGWSCVNEGPPGNHPPYEVMRWNGSSWTMVQGYCAASGYGGPVDKVNSINCD